jgi:hypothetical protein
MLPPSGLVELKQLPGPVVDQREVLVEARLGLFEVGGGLLQRQWQISQGIG